MRVELVGLKVPTGHARSFAGLRGIHQHHRDCARRRGDFSLIVTRFNEHQNSLVAAGSIAIEPTSHSLVDLQLHRLPVERSASAGARHHRLFVAGNQRLGRSAGWFRQFDRRASSLGASVVGGRRLVPPPELGSSHDRGLRAAASIAT